MLVFDLGLFLLYGDELKYKINGVLNNTLESFLVAMVATGIFLGVSYILSFFLNSLAQLSTGSFTGFVQAYLTTFSETTPIFSGNKILTFIAYAVLIALLETRLIFGRLFDLALSSTDTQTSSLKSAKLWFIILIIAALFTYLHVNVRGLTNNAGLLGTFIFGVMSLILVFKRKELESAIQFHMIWNGMITYQQLYR